jgi:hypothetical protein
MEAKETTHPDPDAGTPLPAEQASEVAGGADCPTSVSIGGVTVTGQTPGDVAISVYDGAVAVTSHIMESVANATR